MLKCTILGCGASYGVPVIGCHCKVCTSNDPKNKRTRSSIMIEHDSRILIDTSPDLRSQFLYHNIYYIDQILYTHDHF